MARQEESPALPRVGDLVYHKMDHYLHLGWGIVISLSILPGRCVVFWFRHGHSAQEFYMDLDWVDWQRKRDVL